ncbi:MAG: hypothetical protein ACREI9_04750 [Nitrospiraceae bacterium]
MSTNRAGLNPAAILSSPTCPECGYVVPNDCAEGAGCPKCHARLEAPIPLGEGGEESGAKARRKKDNASS